ncbi:MAG TPA: phosphoglucomutase (alpha-D-glucose-1,6-bisphosphate-dependent) [Steroidobacteraceae bacterium]|jgi:phosphoglucomutase|nr:phosphoglucomutase (alpha-D-glucose-1,6-bisphosphate-dependent) [Steroidobacteraceae bacterium]
MSNDRINPLAGKPAPRNQLVNLPRLITAYFTERPDAHIVEQKVAFGTSGHRGSSLLRSFNEWHVLAITQAICEYRKGQKIDGPLFIGADTHALSEPALASALEVLAANGVDVMMSTNDEYTPTPAVSHAILTYNRGRESKLADGIVITPSHNPPDAGGFKYNPSNGGPADTGVTKWIENRANELMLASLSGVKRVPVERALASETTHRYDYLQSYVRDLGNIIDMRAISAAKVHMAVDPLGGAGVHYWAAIAETYSIDLSVVSDVVDFTFGFMTLDWDGKIRMDPSSAYAMQRLIGLKDQYDVAFACDTDHDRHGIVTRSAGLMPSNHYLSTAIYYLFQHRPQWRSDTAIGKTVVSSQMIDRVAARLQRKIYEVPVGFKWFVDGLISGSLGFTGEESAGATFLRCDGSAWTTDKDGIVAALLSAEITARMGRDPGAVYQQLTREFGECAFDRVDAKATPAQKALLSKLSAKQIRSTSLAGEPIRSIVTDAPGNSQPIGGVKVSAENGWFAARPSGTEDLYKIYAESFRGPEHLQKIVAEAESIVAAAMAGS